MELLVIRGNDDGKSVKGHLTLSNILSARILCDTLEPSAHASFPKIPAGRYAIMLEMSLRFGEITPHLQNVPGRFCVEIHPGNFPQDTHGCLLVGHDEKIPDEIENSRSAFLDLMQLLRVAADPIFITYSEDN